jgi:hypothetical protein
MDYLFVKLFPWMLCALALGVLVGWVSCRAEDQRD